MLPQEQQTVPAPGLFDRPQNDARPPLGAGRLCRARKAGTVIGKGINSLYKSDQNANDKN